MNRVQFTGRLVADLERGETKGGTVVAKGRLAIDRAGQNNETGYVAFESYGPRADAALKTIGKGWLIALDGRLQHDQWEQDGQKRQAYKFVGDIEYLAAPQSRGEGRDVAQEVEASMASEAEAEAEPDLEPAEAIPAGPEAGTDNDAELAMA
jgi:single stranded DNA-binding protein